MIALRCLVALATPGLAQPGLAQDAGSLSWSQDPVSKCRFVAPRALGAGPTRWFGVCPEGRGSGAGVLLRREAGSPGSAFYGEIRAGVIEEDGGYRVGRFIDGDLGPKNLEGQEVTDAFMAGVRGAPAVSARYSGQKNIGSARHYAAVAKRLDTQIR